MIDYIKLVIVPYMNETRKKSPSHTGLVILDEFRGQTTQKVLTLLEEHHLMYVIVLASQLHRPFVALGC